MAVKQKIFSSIRDNKYLILQKHAKHYDVSEAEIIRIIIERVMGNKKLEQILIRDVYEDEISSLDQPSLSPPSLPEDDDVNNELYTDKIPDTCPECGGKEDMTGKNIIVVNQLTRKWSCLNCFASGGI